MAGLTPNYGGLSIGAGAPNRYSNIERQSNIETSPTMATPVLPVSKLGGNVKNISGGAQASLSSPNTTSGIAKHGPYSQPQVSSGDLKLELQRKIQDLDRKNELLKSQQTTAINKPGTLPGVNAPTIGSQFGAPMGAEKTAVMQTPEFQAGLKKEIEAQPEKYGVKPLGAGLKTDGNMLEQYAAKKVLEKNKKMQADLDDKIEIENEMTNTLLGATYDFMNNKVDETTFDTYYPELVENKDAILGVIYDLYNNKETDVEKVVKAYPELPSYQIRRMADQISKKTGYFGKKGFLIPLAEPGKGLVKGRKPSEMTGPLDILQMGGTIGWDLLVNAAYNLPVFLINSINNPQYSAQIIEKLPEAIQSNINETLYNKDMSTLDKVMNLGDKLAVFVQENPDVFVGDIEGLAAIGGKMLNKSPKLMKAISEVSGIGEDLLKSDVRIASKADLEEAMKPIEYKPVEITPEMEKYISKSIKPTVVEKKGSAAITKFNESAVRSLENIIDQGDSIKLIDEAGDLVSREIKTMADRSDAITQSNKLIYDEYSKLAKAQGEAGLTVSTEPIVTELTTLKENLSKMLGQDDTVKYIDKQIEAIKAKGPLDVGIVQDNVQAYNQQLQGFYRNPNYSDYGKTVVDALINNKLRESLENAMEGALKSDRYSKLRDAYAANKQVQKEVSKRATVEARKVNKGLIDFTDFVSADMAVRGIANTLGGNVVGGVTDIVRGSFLNAIKNYYKKLNSPDYNLQQLIKEIKKNRQPIDKNLPLNLGADVGTKTPSGGGMNTVGPEDLKGLEGGKGLEGVKIYRGQTDTSKGLKSEVVEGMKTKAGLETNNELAKLQENVELEGATKAELKKLAESLKKSKGLSASDIMAKYPDINLKRDVPIKDIHGNKGLIPAGEALTPYELKGNKVLLQDGKTYIVSKSQRQNIKGQSISGEAKEFSPELKGTEEMILSDRLNKDLLLEKNEDGTWDIIDNGTKENIGNYPTQTDAINAKDKIRLAEKPTKYSQYTLPGGENYKEILIQAPIPESKIGFSERNNLRYDEGKQPGTFEQWRNEYVEPTFQGSHRDQPNVLAHLRMNERTYNGKKVAFMEELQSDWAREARKRGIKGEKGREEFDNYVDELRKKYNTEAMVIDQKLLTEAEKVKYQELFDKIQDFGEGVPGNPLLKNRQELAIKRALKEAVDSGAEYFAWINGEQTAARYNLSKQVKKIGREEYTNTNANVDLPPVYKSIDLEPIDSTRTIEISFTPDGKIWHSSEMNWKNKKLDEVIGKGLAEKIMSKQRGVLEGEGLNIGGERAYNLYDKQVKDIVERLTGKKVEELSLSVYDKDVKITKVEKNQAIRLTPEVLAKVKGEAYLPKKPSGLTPFLDQKPSIIDELSNKDITSNEKISIEPTTKGLEPTTKGLTPKVEEPNKIGTEEDFIKEYYEITPLTKNILSERFKDRGEFKIKYDENTPETPKELKAAYRVTLDSKYIPRDARMDTQMHIDNAIKNGKFKNEVERAKSVKQTPIELGIYNGKLQIINGNHRVQAAKILGQDVNAYIVTNTPTSEIKKVIEDIYKK